MKVIETEMTRIWLLRKGFEPLRSDCRISRSDGADLETLARQECRIWYDRLLREAPAELLELHDLAAELSVTATPAGSLCVALPDSCVRPVAVKLQGWNAPAVIVRADDPLARRQYLPYCAGGCDRPVAVLHPDNRLELFGRTGKSPEPLEYLLCAVKSTDENGELLYEFAEAALSTI